jgi:hypothetical protein
VQTNDNESNEDRARDSDSVNDRVGAMVNGIEEGVLLRLRRSDEDERSDNEELLSGMKRIAL